MLAFFAMVVGWRKILLLRKAGTTVAGEITEVGWDMSRNLFNRTNIRSIANEPARETLDREIWELGRLDSDPDAPAGSRLSGSEDDPEGSLQMPTDTFGRPFYLNAREFYLGVNVTM